MYRFSNNNDDKISNSANSTTKSFYKRSLNSDRVRHKIDENQKSENINNYYLLTNQNKNKEKK